MTVRGVCWVHVLWPRRGGPGCLPQGLRGRPVPGLTWAWEGGRSRADWRGRRLWVCADWRVFPEVSPFPARPDFPRAFAGLLLVFSVRWWPPRPGTRAVLSPGRQGVREERQTGSGCREAFSQLPSSRHWLVGTEAAADDVCGEGGISPSGESCLFLGRPGLCDALGSPNAF